MTGQRNLDGRRKSGIVWKSVVPLLALLSGFAHIEKAEATDVVSPELNENLKDWPHTIRVPPRSGSSVELDISYRCGRDGRDCKIEGFMKRNQVCGLFVVRGEKFYWQKTRSEEGGTDCDSVVSGGAHGIASITKSITSMLFGMIFNDAKYGEVSDDLLNDNVANLLNGFIDYPDKEVTVRNLLQMRTGMDFRNNRDENRIRVKLEHQKFCKNPAADPRCTIRGQVGKVLADARFDRDRPYNYSNFDTQIIGFLIENRLRNRPDRGAQGDKAVVPPHMMVAAFDEILAPRFGLTDPYKWKADFEQQSPAPCCLKMTGRDVAALGLWIKKQYNSDNGVTGNWLRQSISDRKEAFSLYCRFGTHTVNMQYGYQWWVPNADSVDSEIAENGFVAIGRQGQYMYVFPEQDVVVVQFASWDASPKWLVERSNGSRECESLMVHRLIADEVASRVSESR